MTLTVVYVRVSTEDQVDYSPEAQATRCRQYCRLHDLGGTTVIADEGWSGKNLERPGVLRLLELVEAEQVAHVVVWRLDRLSRDTGDLYELVRLMERHCVSLHSVNEGQVDLATATGRMQVGMHGVFAQFQREQIVENVKMGMEQAARGGRWLNRAPTGYDMVNGELMPNEQAPLVVRIFDLRARGASYAAIEAEVGISYSTVRQILHNKVYLGQTRLRDQWFPGIHQALVSEEEFQSADKAHPHRAGRRGRDVLFGRVRCGLCGRVIGVDYNDRSQALYRCRHRGKGCEQSGRAASGLHRAAVLGLRELADDTELQEAIRTELAGKAGLPTTRGPTRQATVAALLSKRRKLLDLHYEERITAEAFGDEEARLTRQIEALLAEEAEVEAEHERRDELSERFEEVASLLRQIDIQAVWEAGTAAERRVLVEELIEAVVVFPDHLEVRVIGAPALNITLREVGLREGGTTSCVSERGLEPLRPCGH